MSAFDSSTVFRPIDIPPITNDIEVVSKVSSVLNEPK
jgi:hypothetical protein